MKDFRLPKTARNEVYRDIEQVGLNPADFRWSDRQIGGNREWNAFTVSCLTHVPTGYHFTFTAHNHGEGDYLGAQWTPSDVHGDTQRTAQNRLEQILYCQQWLAIVKEEHDEPDLWAALAAESRLMAGEVVGDSANEIFSNPEREILKLRLDEIKAYLVEHIDDPTPEQINQINITFNYAAEASDRLTKKDWKVAFIGSVLPLLISLAVNRDVIHGTMSLAAKYILPLLGQLRFPF